MKDYIEIIAQYGWKGVALLFVVLVLTIYGPRHYESWLDSRSRPGALVVLVKGASGPLSLWIDNKHSGVEDSDSFFRVDSVAPGTHLIELFEAEVARYSSQINIPGGTELKYEANLSDSVSLPDFASLPAIAHRQDGWIFLTADGVTPSSGDILSLQRPAFVRDAAVSGTRESPSYGNAFSTLASGASVEVQELGPMGALGVWARVSVPAEVDEERNGGDSRRMKNVKGPKR